MLLFDIDTFELRHTIDLNDCSNIYTMKCLQNDDIFFGLSDEKILWIIKVNSNEIIEIAKKKFYTDQTEVKKIIFIYLILKKKTIPQILLDVYYQQSRSIINKC